METFKDSGQEIAVHGLTHPFLEQLPTNIVVEEIIKDRESLEKQFGTIVRGMAYPFFGTFNDSVVNVLKMCDIAYARTVISTNNNLGNLRDRHPIFSYRRVIIKVQ